MSVYELAIQTLMENNLYDIAVEVAEKVRSRQERGTQLQATLVSPPAAG